MEMYLADQKKKLRAGEPKKSPMPCLGEAKAIREIMDAFKGQRRYRGPSSPPMPSDLKAMLVLKEKLFL